MMAKQSSQSVPAMVERTNSPGGTVSHATGGLYSRAVLSVAFPPFAMTQCVADLSRAGAREPRQHSNSAMRLNGPRDPLAYLANAVATHLSATHTSPGWRTHAGRAMEACHV